MGDEINLIYDEGYYFIPILNNKTIEGDKIVLETLRKRLSEAGIKNIDEDIKDNFALFFSIQEKIGKEEIDKLFYENNFSEKQYEKIKRKFIK